MNRREFLAGAGAVRGSRRKEPKVLIDRRTLVRRNNPVVTSLDPRSVLSVGNGEFAFTADVTGLQTFPEACESFIPLCTQAQWGWHSFPAPAGVDPEGYVYEPFDTHGRAVGYATRRDGQRELYDWLRENPHRLHLGRIGFQLAKEDVSNSRQELDLWTGVLGSNFQLGGRPVRVKTSCHPGQNALAVEVETGGAIAVRIAFPYGSPGITAADWNKPDAHRTTAQRVSTGRVNFERALDGDRYWACLQWEGSADFAAIGEHEYELRCPGGRFAFVIHFVTGEASRVVPLASAVRSASVAHWRTFWQSGGAIDFGGSTDGRARELERRVVLSQYLTAIQCSGSAPPQETGLTANSWYGKFHLEMHWWHAAHFALWGRTALLEKSLAWYGETLPVAQQIARRQGYAGARWPKMVGPDGHDAPSPIGPLLIWQQPHPIAYAELCRLSHPGKATLERYAEVVFATADFMASYAWKNPATGRYDLGPPVIPAQENHPPRETWNPTFELVYWAHGLKIAMAWRRRLGLPAKPEWQQVAMNLADLPVAEGVYVAHQNCPKTFTERNRDHPSMLAALGMLPGVGVDRETMRRTLRRVFRDWRWPDTWGWDFPMVAMTAARLGERELAVDALLMESPKNEYLPNGHNYQRPGLALYLPGNGGLLAAVSMMAAGWQGAGKNFGGCFPEEGWKVRWEGLKPYL